MRMYPFNDSEEAWDTYCLDVQGGYVAVSQLPKRLRRPIARIRRTHQRALYASVGYPFMSRAMLRNKKRMRRILRNVMWDYKAMPRQA